MEKGQALNLIKMQLESLDHLQKSNINDEAFIKWQRDTSVIIEKIFGSKRTHLTDYKNIRFRGPISFDASRNMVLQNQAFIRGITSMRAFLKSVIDEVEQFGSPDSSVQLNSNPIEDVLQILDKFRSVSRQLQSRYNDRATITVSDEYDVQDLLHALLKLYFDDIRPEEWTPSYAGSSSRMDFLLKNEKIVIEVKKTRNGLKDKEIGEQLIIDKAKYRSHPDCMKLLCFVYDPDGLIGNPASVENDLSETSDDFEVRVIIRPKD